MLVAAAETLLLVTTVGADRLLVGYWTWLAAFALAAPALLARPAS
jgi:hypothetical protein